MELITIKIVSGVVGGVITMLLVASMAFWARTLSRGVKAEAEAAHYIDVDFVKI